MARLTVNPVYSVSLPSGSYGSWGIHYVTQILDPLLGSDLVRHVLYWSRLYLVHNSILHYPLTTTPLSPSAPHHFPRDQYYLILKLNHDYNWVVLPFDHEQGDSLPIKVFVDVHTTGLSRKKGTFGGQTCQSWKPVYIGMAMDGLLLSAIFILTLTMENSCTAWAATSTIPLVTLPINVGFHSGLAVLQITLLLWLVHIAYRHGKATFIENSMMVAWALKTGLSSAIMLTVRHQCMV